MSPRTLPIVSVVTMIAIAAVRSISAWGALPARMASHFGSGGQPDGWQSKASFFVVFGVAGFGTALLLLAKPLLLRWVPARLINIPHREYWLVPERIDEARAKLARYLDWFSVAITLLLVVTLELVLRANTTGTRLDEAVFVPMLIGFFVFLIPWLVRFRRAFRPPGGA